MDDLRFDVLTRELAAPDTRRRLLSGLAALPVLGGLFGILHADEAEAGGGRRKRRKKRHKHGRPRNHGKQQKTCKSESKARTCADTCGSVKNNCQKTVDCGSCDCPAPCGPCFICQSGPNSRGACVVDSSQVGQPCGSDGQYCRADGRCACEAGSCANPSPICADGECVACSDTSPCSNSCCDASGACQPGDTTTACGNAGNRCTTCVVIGEICTAGDCVCPSQVICSASGCCPNANDVCDADDQCCLPADPCTGSACGTVTDNCGQRIDCAPCPPPGISTFTANPLTIDRAKSETSTLNWETNNATTCSIDNGVGSVPCTGITSVGPDASTTYTLSASGAGGGPVTAQATIAVQYCHAIITGTGPYPNPAGTCPVASMYCDSIPIVATASAQAQAACNACFGAGACVAGFAPGDPLNPGGPTAAAWVHTPTATYYLYESAFNWGRPCTSTLFRAGNILDSGGCQRGRWAES